MIIGGDNEIVERLDPIFSVLATGFRNSRAPRPRAARRTGGARLSACRAGHFVKMVHNGIEYG